MRALNLAVSFLLELALLAAGVAWGYRAGGGGGVGVALAIVLGLALASIWGALLAPKARRRLPAAPGVAMSLVLFLLATLVWRDLAHPRWAGTMAAVATLNRIMVLAWRQW